MLQKISILICFLLVVNIAFATNGEEKKSTEKPTTDQQQQGDKKKPTKEIELPEEVADAQPMEIQESDSTEDTSVSKYNFIFYFLYKLKYNENQEVEAIF